MMNRYPNPRGMGPMLRGPRPYHLEPRPHSPRGYGQQQWRRPAYNAPMGDNGTREDHWCETCDRGFPSVKQLERHKQQHQKCNIDGCQFIAHPKVITKHIQMQHSSGLYKKIAKLDNPEEIQKWRDERKKKYPTRSNIEKKAAENKEKIDRGEKMAMGKEKRKHDTNVADGAKRNNRFDRSNRSQKSNKFNGKRNAQHTNAKESPIPHKKHRPTPTIPVTVDKNKLQPFTGILGIIDLEDSESEPDITVEPSNGLIEDDFYEESAEVKANKSLDSQEPAVCGALTSLMCDYGSSDEGTEEKENIKTVLNPRNSNCIEKNTLKIFESQEVVKVDVPDLAMNSDNRKVVLTQADNEANNKSDDDSGPEEVKVEKASTTHLEITEPKQSTSTQNRPPTKNTSHKANNQRQNYKHRHKVPSTLLHKLLHNEITKERNIILQCIRFIRKNNYFDKS